MVEHHTKLLHLLSQSLFQNTAHNADDNVDWNQVVKTAATHAVLPLIYHPMKGVQGVPEELLVNVRQRVLSCVVRNEQVMREQSRVIGILEEADIECAILKGTSVAVHYPQSDLRALGDVDVLVRKSDLETAKEILNQNGYSFNHEHEFHACYMKNGVSIEVHQGVSMFPDTETGAFAKAYMDKALDHVKETELTGHKFKSLGLSQELISLLSHMERHMISGGINLRQLCDWAVTVNACRNRMTSEVLGIIEQCGLLRYAKAMTDICVRYLGMPQQSWAKDADRKAADFIMREILLMESLSGAHVNRQLGGAFYQREQSMLQSYISTIHKKTESEFPKLSGVVVLRPFFWFYYPLRWLIRSLCGTREKVSFAKIAVEANERMDIYSRLAIYE